MNYVPFDEWIDSELRRIEEDEAWEILKKKIAERQRIKMERYLNAPIMGLDGKLVGGKSLSEGEKDKP